MRQEQSQQNNRSVKAKRLFTKPGTLYLIGVPIGHPDDLSPRAISMLRSVDLIATEDPRATQTLLRRHRISATLTSYGPTRIKEKVRILLDRLRSGATIALVSDCGMPAISDPGHLLVAAAHQHRIPVRSIPGPNAATTALTASGFPVDAFHCYGEIPLRKDVLARRLPVLLSHCHPVVVFCQPQGISALLAAIAHTAPLRQVVVACNLSMPDETIYRGRAKKLAGQLTVASIPELVTVIIDGEMGKQKSVQNRYAP